MRMSVPLAALPLIALSVSALAQSLQHEKYQLPNGLTVILHPDPTVPVATINLWYRVGAQNEPPGRSGFAHLYEHLMFMGTRRVPGGDFDTIMEAGGGSNNATTSLDRTNYFSVGPSSILPTLLWLDADRLEDMGHQMDQDKLDKQRDVVRNEIRENVENTPYARAYEQTYRFMFPAGHPYHNAVYGTHADLEAATVHDVKDFFATFYVPRNASLVIAGDFDPAAIKPIIESLYGDLPAGNPPPRRQVQTPALGGVVRWTMLDKVQLPQLTFVYHSPAAYTDGDAEMDLSAMILADGPSSRLYRRLVLEDQTAVSVAAYQDSAQLSSLFWIIVHTRPDADLAVVEASVDQELARFAAEGPSAQELSGRKTKIEMSKLSALQSIEARADKLNEYEFFYGEPDSLQRDLNRFRNATPASVRAWAQRTLTPDARLITTVLPEQTERESASGRDDRPADLPAAEFTPPPPESFTLSNGVNVHLWRKADLPLVNVSVLFTGGGPNDPPAAAGLASLVAEMLSEGTRDLDTTAFADAMQALGASFSAGADQVSVTAGLAVLSRNLEPALSLMADAVVRPRLAQEDWDRVRSIRLESLAQQDQEPSVVGGRVALRMLFGAENPYGLPADGTPETVSPLKLEDVRATHASLLRPERATILVAGDITPAQARAALEKTFGAWKMDRAAQDRAQAPAAPASASSGDGMRLYIVDRPGAVQTVFALTAPAPTASDPGRIPLRLVNTILGGSFTSRLNQNLREEHGYTYGAGSRFALLRDAGWFSARTAVQAEVTGPALKEFLGEITRIRTGDISAEESAKAAATVRNDTVNAFGSLAGTIGHAQGLLAAGLPLDTVSKDLQRMSRTEAAELNRLAAEAIQLDRSVLVLVGDRRLILEQTAGMGLPSPVFVDARGRPAER